RPPRRALHRHARRSGGRGDPRRSRAWWPELGCAHREPAGSQQQCRDVPAPAPPRARAAHAHPRHRLRARRPSRARPRRRAAVRPDHRRDDRSARRPHPHLGPRSRPRRWDRYGAAAAPDHRRRRGGGPYRRARPRAARPSRRHPDRARPRRRRRRHPRDHRPPPRPGPRLAGNQRLGRERPAASAASDARWGLPPARARRRRRAAHLGGPRPRSGRRPAAAAAAALGTTGLRPGQDQASLGTSGWVASARPPRQHPTPSGASHRLALAGGAELHTSAVLAAGAAAAWARQAYLAGTDAQDADRRLSEREREHGRGPTGLLVLPTLGGERYPIRDDSLRGAVLGIDASTGPDDLYSATLEGVALALSHALEGGDTDRVLPVVGGGAVSAPWRRILADVTGRPVLLADGTDATLLGAAIAGADALGLDHGIAPLVEQAGDLTAPDPSAAAAYAGLRPVHRGLYETVAGVGR